MQMLCHAAAEAHLFLRVCIFNYELSIIGRKPLD